MEQTQTFLTSLQALQTIEFYRLSSARTMQVNVLTNKSKLLYFGLE